MPVLELRNLTKTYGDSTVVAGLDLVVESGHIVGLLGPNGAGKTTTISMIAGLTAPSAGTAVISGHDVRTDPRCARAAIGLVPQDLALYDDLNARQNLAFFGSLYKLRGKELDARIDWALDIAGLRDRAGEPVAQFSGGMKRRLNLSAGLLHKPELLLLDEPTVGVDPQSRNHIFESIRALRDEHAMTVLYCSHYLEEVQQLCERVAILDHGQVLAHDSVERLLAGQDRGPIEVEIAGDLERAHRLASAHGEVTVTTQGLSIIPRHGYGVVLSALEDSGFEIRSVRTINSNLEALFLSLTGHQLRDE